MENHGGVGLLRHYQRVVFKHNVLLIIKEASEDLLMEILATVYPEHIWIRESSQPYFKAQSNLHSILSSLYPKEDIHVEFKHPEAFHSSGKPMELDLYIPSLGIAFEYQGQQHYQKSIFGDKGEQQIRDSEKKEACKKAGITLIEVPYWWDGTEEDLRKFIEEQTGKI